LAVLSACQTGSGRYYAGEGTLSLARAFLVSGVPVVLSSLWPVDSQATAELMINFHKFRKQGFSTAEALKQAQLEMLSSPQNRFHHPYYWSAFSVLGGSESFSGKKPVLSAK
jgi:CHAT domain-containing protein